MSIFSTTCFLIIIPSILGSLLSKKRTECFFATSLLSNGLLLYLFGWIGYLKAGLYTVYIINSLMFLTIVGLVAFHIFKKNKIYFLQAGKQIITPGVVFFVLGVIFAEYISFGRIFILWDEFSHWGRIATVIFNYDTLPLTDKAVSKLIAFKAYPPGSALIQYLFAKTADFSESEWIFYYAKQVIFLSVFSLFCAKIRWKDFGFALILFFSSFIVCATFTSNFFVSLYVDILLSVLFASMCYFALYEKKMSWWSSTSCFITGSFLILTKPSGTGLFVIFFSTMLFCCIYCIIKSIRNKNKKYIIESIKFLIPACSLLFYFLQKVLLKNANISSSKAVTIQQICDAWLFNIPKTFDTIWNKMLTALFETKSINLGIFSLSYFMLALLIAVVIFLLAKFSTNNYSKRFLLFSTIFFVGFFVYAGTLLILYTFKFSAYEGARLASFGRYMATYMVIGLLLLFICSSINFSERNSKTRYLLLLIFIPFIGNFSGYFKTFKSLFNINNNGVVECEIAKNIISPHLGDKQTFFGVHQGNTGFMKWTLSLAYLNRYRGGGSYGGPHFKGDIWSRNISKKAFQNLVKHYDFCYVSKSSSELEKKYGDVFASLPIKDQCFYKSTNGKLYPLSNKQFSFDFKRMSFFKTLNCNRAISKYSVKEAVQNVKLMDKAEITLTAIKGLPLDNGNVESIEVEFADISGAPDFNLIINGVELANQRLENNSSYVIKKHLNNIVVQDIKLKFSTKEKRASLKIKKIFLRYAEKNSQTDNTVVLNDSKKYHSPNIFDWGSPARKPIPSGFSVKDKRIVVFGKSFYKIPSTGKFRIFAKIKNKGNKNTTIFFGLNILDKQKKRIAPAVSAVKGTDSILSRPAKKGDTQIYVTSVTNWRKQGRHVVFYTSPDFSDLPNYSYLNSGFAWINDIAPVSENEFVVKLTAPLKCDLPQNIHIRQHNRDIWSYFYLSSGQLKPNEKKIWQGEIIAKPRIPGFKVSDGWPIGAEYCQLLLLSYSSTEHEIEVTDVKVEFIPDNTASASKN